MPDNLIQPVMGKICQRIVLEMDAKGTLSVDSKTLDPFGGESAMAPIVMCTILSSVLSTIIKDMHNAAIRAVRGMKTDGIVKE